MLTGRAFHLSYRIPSKNIIFPKHFFKKKGNESTFGSGLQARTMNETNPLKDKETIISPKLVVKMTTKICAIMLNNIAQFTRLSFFKKLRVLGKQYLDILKITCLNKG